MLQITLPFPPSINGLYGGGSGQRRFPSKQYKAWLAKCPRLEPHKFGSIDIEYHFYFPDNRNRDSENYIKAIGDYLVNEGVLLDDNWRVVKKMTLIPMGIDKKNSRVEIVLKIV